MPRTARLPPTEWRLRSGYAFQGESRDDAERQALLEADGERVIRVTWEQAVCSPAQSLARIRAAGAPPG